MPTKKPDVPYKKCQAFVLSVYRRNIMIKHIIFDCFGTLIDTGSTSVNAAQRILSDVGSSVDARTFYADWKAIKRKMMYEPYFRSEKKLYEESLSEAFKKYGINADAAAQVKPMIDSLFSVRICFPEVRDTLQSIAARGIDIAIGSTTDNDSLMHYLRFNNMHMEHIFTSEDMQVYKPAKQFYQTILDKSGWAAQDCLFVGDSYEDDVMGAKSVGIKAVLIDRKDRYDITTLNPAPDYCIKSLAELGNII